MNETGSQGYISDKAVQPELSDYGKLNAMRKELNALWSSCKDDEGMRHRCLILIANIDNLKHYPDDPDLLKQFAKNTADLERYKAGRV